MRISDWSSDVCSSDLCRNSNTTFSTTVPRDVTFDALIYADVLEHLDDPTTVLRAHMQQLAPDGVVLGSVPNGYGPCEIEKYIQQHLHLYEIARWPLQMARNLTGPSRPHSIPEERCVGKEWVSPCTSRRSS